MYSGHMVQFLSDFLTKIERTLSLLLACFQLAFDESRLFLLAMASALTTLVVFWIFTGPVFGLSFFSIPSWSQILSAPHLQYKFVIFAVLVERVLHTYIKAILIHFGVLFFRGEEADLSLSSREVFTHFKPLLFWAAFDFLVTSLIRMFFESYQAGRSLIAKAFEVAWGAITYLVIPILVIEKISAQEAIKTSIQHFKTIWGEQVVLALSFWWVRILVMPIPYLVFNLAILESPFKRSVLFGCALVIYFAFSSFIFLTESLMQSALYVYVKDGSVSLIESEVIESSFEGVSSAEVVHAT